jgi:hypothetical protein
VRLFGPVGGLFIEKEFPGLGIRGADISGTVKRPQNIGMSTWCLLVMDWFVHSVISFQVHLALVKKKFKSRMAKTRPNFRSSLRSHLQSLLSARDVWKSVSPLILNLSHAMKRKKKGLPFRNFRVCSE